MRWIGVALVLCSLGQLGTPKQSPGSADNLATPLKLDPVLRRALLRALTQLELEAQRRASAGGIPESSDDEDPPVDPEQEANIKRDLEELLGNYERDSRKSEQSVEKMDVIVMDGEQPEQADVSVFDYEAPAEQDPETQRSTNEQPIDIQYNIIPSNSRSSNQRPQDSNAVATSVDKSVSDALKLNLDGQEVSIFQAPLVAAFTLQQDEKGNPRRVVPLIRRPQPIVAQQQQRLQQQSQRQQQIQLQQEQPQLQQQTQLQQQQHQLQQQTQLQQQQSQLQQPQLQQQQSQLQKQTQLQQPQLQQQQTRLQQQPQRVAEQQLSREQELERRTRLLEEQLRQLQQQYQQQQLLKQQEIERERLRLFQEQQRQRFQFQFLPVEQTPPPPPPPVRAQRQETGTAIVDFQQSSGFHFRPQHNNNIFHQDPNHVNSQLQNLLYQSGVATPQEDLNIVSKVLSLNHEGRIHRPHRETLEGIVPPSRVIAPPFP